MAQGDQPTSSPIPNNSQFTTMSDKEKCQILTSEKLKLEKFTLNYAIIKINATNQLIN